MLEAYLISVGVMCAISTVLAIVMVLADATIANYGEVHIRVNDEKDLTVEGGGNLLATLKGEQIFIPSACGGRGSCGLCKVEVKEGAGPLLPTETPWLSREEQAGNIRLACQVRVKRDLNIVIPEALFNVRQFQTRVSSIRDLTHDIKEVTLDLVDPDTMDFIAGQFVQVEVPPYALTEEPVYRAYSIASDPARKDRIELEVRYVPNGICTTYIHQHLKEGQSLTVNGPYGDFYLRDSDRDIICIAGGSGMAPIKSILHHMVNTGSRRRTRYFFGAKSKRDLFLLEDMQALQNKLASFQFIPALSEPAPEDQWDGETGLITEVVGRHVESAAASEAYLCGSPLMIDACIDVLKGKGMPEELIYYDKFA